eukprot:TRINITY_DN3946_c0_g1_i2.p1 TRINITY_DN3946_c0_g1~~TRINITY_DN3946_c0_g1_i2.p1  ORF type:complete len:428 (-),score=70.76 TRINITY_DN3946_c0_g1_i2:209-1456(-)
MNTFFPTIVAFKVQMAGMDAYFIELTDEHPVELVVKHITTLKEQNVGQKEAEAFSKQCQQLIEEDKAIDLITVVLENMPIVLSKAQASSQQAVLSVVMFMLRDFDQKIKPQAVDKLLESLKNVVVASEDDKEKLREASGQNQLQLDAMLTLYNLVGSTKVLFAAIEYAIKAELQEILAPGLVQQMIPQIEDLGLSENEMFDLILLLVDLLTKCKGESAFKELYKLREMGIKKVPSDKLNLALSMAEETAVEVLRNQDVYRVDIMDYPAVKQLQNSPDGKQIYQLLQIIRDANINTFQSTDFENTLNRIRTTKEQFLLKLRTVGLLRLVEKGGKMFKFDAIAEVLKCDVAEVELIVLNAVGKGMLVGRMNQVEKVLEVTSTVCVNMQQQAWGDLRTRVKDLRTSLKAIQQSMVEAA